MVYVFHAVVHLSFRIDFSFLLTANEPEDKKTSKALGDALRRLAPALRQLGVNVKSLGKHGAYVKWVFSTCESQLISSLECLHVSPEEDLKT